MSQLTLDEAEYDGRVYIASNDHNRVVRHVIFLLNGPHLFWRCRQNDLPVTDYILSTEVSGVELRVHLSREREKRARFISVVFPDHDLALALELVAPE